MKIHLDRGASVPLHLHHFAAAALAQNSAPPPVTFTADQDHQNMMDQLGIKALRPGSSGNEKAPNHANYDESKANPYPDLPDPLTTSDGQKVTTPEMWWNKRRPEIVEMYSKYVYGRVPDECAEGDVDRDRRGSRIHRLHAGDRQGPHRRSGQLVLSRDQRADPHDAGDARAGQGPGAGADDVLAAPVSPIPTSPRRRSSTASTRHGRRCSSSRTHR